MDAVSLQQVPPPDADQLAHSEKLLAHIRRQIESAGGIPFSRYMDLALYAPGLGYYSAGARKFGEAGDFVTSPEVSPLFAACVARTIVGVFAELPRPSVLELGAGSGVMAAALLKELAAHDSLPETYYILDLSPELQVRQQALIANLPKNLAAKVRWLSKPPKNFSGVIFANEVVDALPVEKFRVTTQGVEQVYVRCSEGRFVEDYRPATSALISAVTNIQSSLPSPLVPGYISEVCALLPAWCETLVDSLAQGVVLICDYGYPHHEYYLPERDQGTLICHYRHRGHADPYWYPGLQDISSFVDFTYLAESFTESGLEFEGFVSQSQYLRNAGLQEIYLQEVAGLNKNAALQLAQQIKKLTLPGEMGDKFAFIAFSRGMNEALVGFEANHNYRL